MKITLNYEGKKKETEIFRKIKPITLNSIFGSSKNISKLIKGENLQVMKYLMENLNLKGKIDLVYIDPPFSTKNLFRYSKDKANTISSSRDAIVAYEDNLDGPEYLEFLRERLILIKELLSEQGSIYIHIDCKVGHYVKIVMDEIFGNKNFINDITRIKCNPKNFERKAFGNIKDMILFYSKTGNHIWNEPREPLTTADINRLFKKVDKDGRRYATIPLHAPGETINGETGGIWKGMYPPKGRHWRCSPAELDELDKKGMIEWSKAGVPRKKIYADENIGKKIQDIIEFKDPQNPVYPTEKNYNLLKLLISTSSNPGSIVLDCFCGSGTTLKAAQDLGRYWIGIDKSDVAIELSLKRLNVKQGDIFAQYDFEYLEQVEATNA